MSVYAWADLHGRLDIFNEGLKYLTPEDKVYFLGDAADRGPDGWAIIKTILNDKRFTYIKGNHEDLMIKAIGNFQFSDEEWHWNKALELWYWNGGQTTHDAFYEDNSITDKEKIDILNQIKSLPFCAIYTNKNNLHILLSHAGCDNLEDAELLDEEHFIWDRTHLMFYDSWDGNDDEYIIHGHTPIELMIEEQEKNAAWSAYDSAKIGIGFNNNKSPKPWNGKGAYYYGQGHKINIDTGAIWNNTSVLLNLDTWEEIIINVPSLPKI